MADFYDWANDTEGSSKGKAPKKEYNYFRVEPDYSDYYVSNTPRYGEDRNIYSSRNTKITKKNKKSKANDEKKTKITAICCLCAIIITCLFSFFYIRSIPTVAEGDTEITLVVIYPNGETDNFSVSTSSKFLGEAIVDAGYAETDDQAADNYRTINGVTVEGNAKWVFTRGGKELSLSVNKTPIEDGEVYTATYTK